MRGRRIAALLLLWAGAAGTWWIRGAFGVTGGETRKARAIPAVIGPWRGRDIPVSASQRALLLTQDFVFRSYTRPGVPGRVVLLATWAANDFEAVHPSDDCFTANGYEITGWGRRLLRIPGRGDLPVILKEVRGRGERRIYFDLFRSGGGWSLDVWSHMARLLWRAVTARDVSGGKIRVETVLGPGGKEEAVRRIEGFLSRALPVIEEALR